jgi:hypothetical protein
MKSDGEKRMSKEREKDVETPVSITLIDGTVCTVGYVTPWPTDADTFDGWLAQDDEPTDKLIVNGATEAWAHYRVLRAYMQEKLDGIDATEGDPAKLARVFFVQDAELLAATSEALARLDL